MRIVVPSLLGVEAIIASELRELGYEKECINVNDGTVSLTVADDVDSISEAVAKLNIYLRTGERVQVEVAKFSARTFDELYDAVQKIAWEEFIPENWAFIIKGYSRKSDLYGVPGIQRTIKKGIVNRLLSVRNTEIEGVLEEDANKGLIRLQFSILSNEVHLLIDTSGNSLHKRGYRLQATEAPLKETLAAALLKIMRWEPFSDEALLDPFCGSGTIAIEAAMMAANIPPGLNRSFDGEKWPFLNVEKFKEIKDYARTQIDTNPPDEVFIFASDIDKESINIAIENAMRANVRSFIKFARRDVSDIVAKQWFMAHKSFDRCLILGNPPYGERISTEEEVQRLHATLGNNFLPNGELLNGIRMGMITSSEDFEKVVGKMADKRRKLYNGMIKCCFYQYFRHRRLKKNG